ncbi:MAG TPA: DUF6544 family protein [Vicinamibacteria bacterium]|nr:DUF6544 family protein [Vicinamibacteria bacterium]
MRRTIVGPGDAEALPQPVHRYFERALPEGQRRIAWARVQQRGSFLVRAPGRWRQFRATQTFTTRPPGFVWDARIRLLAGVPILVRDSFHEGAGSMRATLLGFRLADTAGTPAIATAALQRYLAEAALLPTALLPSAGVSWTPIDASSARASLAAGTTRVSLEFRFGGDGLVESVYAPARMRDVKGQGVATPWLGRWWDYEEQDGLLAPRRGEVEWLLPQGPRPYWRGEITRIEYELG